MVTRLMKVFTRNNEGREGLHEPFETYILLGNAVKLSGRDVLYKMQIIKPLKKQSTNTKVM